MSQTLDASKVHGSPRRVLTDLVTLVRYAFGLDTELVSYRQMVAEQLQASLQATRAAADQKLAQAERLRRNDEIRCQTDSERDMTTRDAFSADEWTIVLEGPSSAGMIVSTAASGGMFREPWALPKAYVETRQQHGESELLDEIVAAKPEIDHTKYHSVQEVKDGGLARLRDAVALLESKATTEELEGYRRFVLTLAKKVADAHKEEGQSTSPSEAEAIQEIGSAVGETST